MDFRGFEGGGVLKYILCVYYFSLMERCQILIVDEDARSREALRLAVAAAREGAVVVAVPGGREGLALLKAGGFACVFLGDTMSGGDGVWFLREACAAAQGLTPAPVVVMMRRGCEQAVIEAIRAGAQEYLDRDNITPETVRVAINQAEEIYDLRRRHRQAQEQLFQVQKLDAVGQLTGGIAHDFNNLLTIILGNARLLGRLAGDAQWEGEKHSRIGTIEATARRGAELVRRLMVFSRQQPFDCRVADLNEALGQLSDLLGHTLGETVFVKSLPAPDLWPVNIDVGQFENAVLNMAVNARDAMPRGGTLTIETQNVFIEEDDRAQYPDAGSPDAAPGAYVMVAVSDDGEGMEPEVAARIFEPFFTTKPAGHGTGLGLSMAYGFVRESGGMVHVYSEKGRGTVFRMYLPRAAAAAASLSPFPREAAAEGGNGETVMIVDDDERLRQVAEIMLCRLGYRTVTAASGEEAIGLLAEGRRVDAVLTDISMRGGMSGIELAERLENIRPGTGVLFMTGFSENALCVPGMAGGRGIVIGKPFRREILARRLKDVLGGGAALEERKIHAVPR